MPEWLYHYTNIESLALILSNKTIRFRSLNQMDDLQEEKASDIRNVGQFVYVSSWTDSEKESIPMWKMYSTLEAGVRIKMRSYPFYEYENTPELLLSAGMPVIDDSKDGTYPKTIIPYHEWIDKGFVVAPSRQHDMLFQIEYTDDREKLIPNLMTKNNDSISIATGLLGKCKNTHWDFQYEWRYIFVAFPIDAKKGANNNYINMQSQKFMQGNLKQAFPFYDIRIDDKAFGEMELVMSPRISKGNEVIVQSLLNRFNPTATLLESDLKGKI